MARRKIPAETNGSAKPEAERMARERFTEQALQESVERFRATFENMAVGMAHVDFEGRWLQVNRKFCKILGYSHEEMLSLKFQEITHPDDLASDLEWRRRLREGVIPAYSIEKRYIRKDGSTVWVKLTGSLVRDATGRAMYYTMVVEDIDARKRAEEALREREEHFRLLTETVPAIVWSTDMEGKIEYFSGRWLGLTGMTRGESMGEGWMLAVHPEDMPRVLATMEHCKRTNKPFDMTYRIRTAEGTWRWHRSRALPQLDDAGQVMRWHGVTCDIHELRAMAESLGESERRAKALLDANTESMFLLDLEGNILAANATGAGRFGLSATEIIGKNVYSLFPSGLARARRARHEEAMRSGQPQRYEDQRNGIDFATSVYPVRDAQGQVTGLAVFSQDVTEEKRAKESLAKAAQELERRVHERTGELEIANEQLRASEEWFRLLVEGVKEYAIFRLDPRGYVTSWNAGAERIIGYRAEEIIGQHCSRFFSEEDIAARKPEMELATAAAEGKYEEEGWYVRKDGSRFWASVTLTALYGRQGEVIGFSKIARDMTKRQRMEQALRESNSELEAFAYTLSHDMRAPLRAMSSFSEILMRQQGEALGAAGRSYLERIVTTARRLDALIHDVLDYSRVLRAQITLHKVDVERLLKQLIQENPNLQPPKAEICIKQPLHPVLGHEASLTQCLTNLLSNAVKFVAPGVKPNIRIWTESVQSPEPTVHSPQSMVDGPQHPGSSVRIWVEDNGIGIPRELQGRLFGLFQRLHSGYEGTGIGLSIVRKAVERMGGRVGVESEPGKGSRFWLELSAAD